MSGELAPCRRLHNCVSSRADAAPSQRIAPLAVVDDPMATFGRLKSLLRELERTEIVVASESYVHAVCRSRLGLIDDLEFLLCRKEGVIHVRSGARYGIHDMGVNRRRVETLRMALQRG